MIRCVSVSHRSSDFEFLEALTTRETEMVSRLRDHRQVAGTVVLSTCNRFEVYVDTEHPDALSLMAEATGLDATHLDRRARVLSGEQVAHHLFAVASGLESVVVGEDEISGQVSRALTRSRERGMATSRLERLFQSAAKTSRGVKTRTAIGTAGRSLVRLALELASSRFTDWPSLRVLLVGTGDYAATTVAALRDRGAREIGVHSPSGRAAAFATKYGLTTRTDLVAAIATADLIICCTSNEQPVITSEHVRPGAPRLFVDLGLPRNVSHEVAGVDHVEVLDLETIRLHAPLEELSATADARELIRDAATRFTAEAHVGPAIVAMRKHVLELVAAELERHPSNPEIERALRHFAGVLLYEPSARARELAGSGRAHDVAAAVETLFGVPVTLPEATPAR